MKPELVNIKSVLVILISIFFIACGKREAYFQFKELKGGDWAINQTLMFDIDSMANIELDTPYDISVELTNNMDYPYRNLWVEMFFDKGDSIKEERKEEFILADEYAKWKGAGFGSLFQSSHLIEKGYIFRDSVKLNIFVRHIMHDKNLHGIEKIGIKINKASK